jgi:multidrug efflux pump
VHNNIVLIDTYNQLRRDMPHESVHQSIVRTGAQRLRPVFLTVATCVLGLIPMALHLSVDLINREVIYGGTVTSFWVPLARSICFGLSFATVLTLIVTPAMLALPLRLKSIVGTLFKRAAAAPAEEPVAAPTFAEGATVVALPERPRRHGTH